MPFKICMSVVYCAFRFSTIPIARTSLCAFRFQSMLITVGGSIIVNGKWIRLATTGLLDTTNGCWYTCDDLPIPHNQLKTAIVSNKLYLLGGNNKDFESSSQVFSASLKEAIIG